MKQTDSIDRKNFLNILLGVGITGFLGAVFYPIARFMIPPKLPEASISRVSVGKITELDLNESKFFKFGRVPGLLIRTSDDEFKAYIATCTHLDCTVQFRSDIGIIWCACHNGQYDLNGINVAGPPPRPLTPLDVHITGEDIFISAKS